MVPRAAWGRTERNLERAEAAAPSLSSTGEKSDSKARVTKIIEQSLGRT